jgi:hypothetical protein
MQDVPDFWSYIGVNLSALMAGLAGGVVGAWADGKSGLLAWMGYIMCGGLTGAYLGESASHVIPATNPAGAGFIVGGCALVVMRLLRGVLSRYGLKLSGGNGMEDK